MVSYRRAFAGASVFLVVVVVAWIALFTALDGSGVTRFVSRWSLDGGVGAVKEVTELIPWRRFYLACLAVSSLLTLVIVIMGVVSFYLRRAEEKVARGNRRIASILKHMEEVFWVGSVQGGFITEISPSVEHHTGISMGDAKRDPERLLAFLVAEDRPRFLSYALAIENGGVQHTPITFRIMNSEGRLRWFRFMGFPMEDGHGHSRVAGMCTDITEAFQEDRAMKALVETLVETTGCDLYRKVVSQLCDYLGCDLAFIGEVVGDEVHLMAGQLDGASMKSMSYRLKGTPCMETISTSVCFYQHGVRNHFPESAILEDMKAEGYMGLPIRNADGKVIGLICTISRSNYMVPARAGELVALFAKGVASELERMRIDRERRDMEVHLVKSQKMQAMGTLAEGIAHDFNNILTPVIGYVQLMQEEVASESEHGIYLEKISQASFRARKLVQQILTFSRHESQVKEPVDMEEVMEEVVGLVRSSFPSSISLKSDIGPALPMVMGEATAIHQVVMNLLTNARHALEADGGEIVVEVSRLEEVPVRARVFEPWVRLKVRDNGCGIDPMHLDRIFDPYFTTRPKEKGTGLGLSVVHGIVSNLGGDVGVKSTPGEGTSITIYLPGMAPGTRARKPVESVRLSVGPGRLVLVDDEPEVGEVTAMMLERLGYEVTRFDSGESVLAHLEAHPGETSLLLTDMTMPRMSGVQLIETMKSRGIHLPVLLCTGFADESLEHAVDSLGISGIVRKPASLETLKARVADALEAGVCV